MEKPTHTQVIGITSGKPGVGKTTVSVNLAVALHDLGYAVMILDANTSTANAQTALGSICPFKLEDFFSGKKALHDIILKRHYGIELISGATAVHDMSTLSAEQAKRTLEAFSKLEEHLDFLKGKIAKWWMPDDVVALDEIPLGATGKIDKKLLRERMKDYRLPDVQPA